MNRLLSLFASAALALGGATFLASHTAVAADSAPTTTIKPLKVLLVTGGCCHDYSRQKEILKQGISARTPAEFTIVHEGDNKTDHKHSIYANKDWWKGYDVVIHDECSASVKDIDFIENVLAAHKAGVPAVVLHCGMHNYRSEGFPNKTPWFEFTGLKTTGHGPQQPISLTIVDKESPITQGQPEWTTINEELYNNVAGGVEATAKPLIKGKQTITDKKTNEKKDVETIVAWTNDYKGTKVFATTVGHNNDTVADARYLNLVTRGLLWSVGKLDDKHFKASDQNVDVKAIKVEPKPDAKKASASAVRPGIEILKDVPCCGNE
ncbi:ThuA domain-containing protein [Humisphaera borealis]|uniref:ThuA domain-containing protein n=1 Tax=Humisphaera borealis TaxID=2807512 RepID=A0A7M2WVC6_9BACT|nr:ThuA domain-containing protein [Humisphaera borealis]QOV89182.1 ThuA domain-containing protein [Humisphaera borealis]